MPGIAPIHDALMYNSGLPSRCADISSRLAPPYDVVTARLLDRLIEADPTNSAAIDVPQLPVDRTGPHAAYARARRVLDAWIEQQVLHRLDAPVFGLLRQTFRERGPVVRRHAVMAELPLLSLGRSDGLYAHEQTDCGPRGDRLALLKSLRVQTSPIFGIYSDDQGSVEEFVRSQLIRAEPRLVGMAPDDTLSELWLVEDPASIDGLLGAFGSRDLIIADGHHRYASQFAFQQSLGAQATVAARSCMMALVAQEDAGMTIRAIHHVFGGMVDYSIDVIRNELGDLFRFEEVTGGPVELERQVARAWFERSIPMGLFDFAQRRSFVISSIEVDPLASAAPEAPEAWRRAAPVVCQRLLVERCLRGRCNAGREPARRPVSDLAEMNDPTALLDGAQIGVIMLPLRLADVLAIASSGFLLPSDSTFFWPKMPTGLLFKSLE